MSEEMDIINKVWDNRELLKDFEPKSTILSVIDMLDRGVLRVAEPIGAEWKVNG